MSAAIAMAPSPEISTRWWMALLQALAASLGLALVAAIVFEVQDAREAGVTQLQLEGAFRRVDPDAVREVLQPKLAAGVLGPQMEEVKAQLEQLPWVARARVERAWPGAVRVRIWEYAAYARWNDALLSMDGAVFRVPEAQVPEGLPRLSGPDGRQQKVRDTFELLASSLRDTALAPAALALNDRGDWTARTGGGVELRFGRADLAEQIEFIKGPVSQALAGKLSEVEYVDLHYSNGFAVGARMQPKPRQAVKR